MSTAGAEMNTRRPALPISTHTITLTPFTTEGALDESSLRAHLQRLGGAGVGVYVAGSGSGEGYTLSRSERRRVMEIAGEELAGVVPVRSMGVEPRTAAEAIELGQDTADVGLDAMQLYSLDMGHGYRPRRAELEIYLTTVLETVSSPVVISTHQSVGYRYDIDLLDTIIDRFEAVIGINITTADIGYLADVIDVVDGRVDVHVGGPMHALTALAIGGQGFLSSEGNLIPRRCAEFVYACAAGRHADVQAAYTDIMAVFRATQRAGGIVGAKAALRRLEAPGGWPRLPRVTPPDDPVDALIEVLAQRGLLDYEALPAT